MNRASWFAAGCFLAAIAIATGGCGDIPTSLTSSANTSDALIGTWRATLASPGGTLPFTLRFEESTQGVEAVVINGVEKAPTSSTEIEGREVVIAFDFYDSEIKATLSEDGAQMTGRWRRTGEAGADSILEFEAVRGNTERFRPLAASGQGAGDAAVLESIGGVWASTFVDEDGPGPARGELEQTGERVTGTFLTPTGDYRYLEGRFEGGLLRLSTFDGAHAFLFHARTQADGSLVGNFWSRDSYHATWTATLVDPETKVLPDPWSQASLTNDEGRFRFAFPNLVGETVGHDDPRFRGKVVLVNIFGSWCPNCNDDAPLLSGWDRRFGDQGLAIVGLAFEFTGNAERDRLQVRRFAERHAIEFPLLLAGGTSEKADAAALLPDLDRIVAFPTTVFIGRDGLVRKIYSGFAGPGTGAQNTALVEELEALVVSLLAEPIPDA